MCNPCGNSGFVHIHPYPRGDTHPASPESAAARGTAGTNTNWRNVCSIPSSILLLVCLWWKPAGKAGPFHPIWHIRHLFGDVLKSFQGLNYIFLWLYDSEQFLFSLKSSQCHNLHGKIQSCVCATELGEGAEYSLCFSVSLWAFKTRECSVPTWYIIADCQR